MGVTGVLPRRRPGLLSPTTMEHLSCPTRHYQLIVIRI
ncbi:hypothetical protein FM119_12905 [Mycetocola reblochoni REB411]|uniref:Uncharacterized protein n=1 Tax=Mycetocola reblochoni REB411 TaxID=1255698 RepID=A0A1R4KCH1_9MICO|nr:hypothetical protein FM119_12905 [Mycetocola reblochoni REB411]